MNHICSLVSNIVFSGINGIILIPFYLLLIWVVVGQVKDVKRVTEQVLKKGVNNFDGGLKKTSIKNYTTDNPLVNEIFGEDEEG